MRDWSDDPSHHEHTLYHRDIQEKQVQWLIDKDWTQNDCVSNNTTSLALTLSVITGNNLPWQPVTATPENYLSVTTYLSVSNYNHSISGNAWPRSGLERKEENIPFNDTLNAYYLRLYDVRHMVKDHSNSKWWILLPSHGLLFPISIKGSFICIIQQTG